VIFEFKKKYIDKLLLNKGLVKYFFNTAWLFSENFLRMMMSLLVGIWVARYLGPTLFGVFSYSLAFAAIFTSITNLGLDDILVRDFILEKNKIIDYIGTAFWLRIIGSILLLLVLGIGINISSNDYLTNIYILIIASGSIFQSFNVIDLFFQSQAKSKITSIAKLLQLLISSAIRIYLIFIEANLIWFVVVMLFDQITLASILAYSYYKKKLKIFYNKFSAVIAVKLLKDGWPPLISGIAIITYIRIDQLLINYYLGSEATGIYSVAVRLSEVWYIIPVLITQSIFPSLVNSKINDKDLYDKRISQLYTMLVLFSIMIAMITSFLGEWIVNTLYGEAYSNAATILILHIWGGIFVALGVVGGKSLINENKQYLLIHRAIFGAILNIILSMYLIPIYGLMGAAFATLTAIIFSSYALDFFGKNTRKMFYQKTRALLFIDFFTYLRNLQR